MKRSVFFLLLLPLQIFAQIIPIRAYDVPTALISGTQNFTTENFREYLKGNGDLFMEYGIRSLCVQDLRYKDQHVTVEIYEMTDAGSAYGIYSVTVLGCKATGLATDYDCYSGSGYSAASGRFYIRMNPEIPQPADKNLFTTLSRQIIKNNPDSAVLIPGVFNQYLVRRFNKEPYCMKGVLGLQQSPLPVPWQNLFTMVRATVWVVILPSERDIYFARVIFQDPSDLNTFLMRAGLMNGYMPVPNTTTSDGLYREYRQIDDRNIYYLESQLPFSISSLVP